MLNVQSLKKITIKRNVVHKFQVTDQNTKMLLELNYKLQVQLGRQSKVICSDLIINIRLETRCRTRISS